MMGVADNTDAAQAAQADQAHKLVVYFVPDSQHAHDVLQWIEKKGASQPVSHENKLRLAAVAAWNDPHWIQRASR